MVCMQCSILFPCLVLPLLLRLLCRRMLLLLLRVFGGIGLFVCLVSLSYFIVSFISLCGLVLLYFILGFPIMNTAYMCLFWSISGKYCISFVWFVWSAICMNSE